MSKLEMKKARQIVRREARAQLKENGEKYMKRTRQIIRFLILVIIIQAVVILCSGCEYSSGIEPISELHENIYVSSRLYMDESGDTFSKIWIINSEYIPVDYLSADLYIDNNFIGEFHQESLIYYSAVHGNFSCHIIFKLIEGNEILYDRVIL